MGRFGNHQYITVVEKQGIVIAEGTFNEEFKNRLKLTYNGIYDPENTRWKMPIRFKDQIIALAKRTFDKVFYSEGGDYTEL